MLTKTIPDSAESPCSPQDVVSQLNVILAHELFSNSPVLSTFLKYVVEETLYGNVSSLKEYTIGVNGLGKKTDFNPQVDAIVRIHAGRLRRLLAQYYKDEGRQDKILIEVVKGSYVPVFSVRYVRQEMPKTLRLSLDRIKQVAVSKVTLAILPFRNLSPQGDYQFFADGLGEEFTRVFSTSDDLSVIGHHSTLKYSLQHANLHMIGSKLNAHYVVTGTVMRNANHFRINVGLMETQMSTQIWSKVFDYAPDTDFIEVQDQTIQRVYAILGGQFGFIIRHRASLLKAVSDDAVEFDPAIWNYNFHVKFSFFHYAKMRRVLEIVQQGDPSVPKAMAMLAELYLWGHVMGFPTVDNPVATSLQLAHKALNIDPGCADAHFSFLWASLYSKGKEVTLRDAEPFVATASVTEAGKLGVVLVCSGHYEQARALLTESIQQCPQGSWSVYLALCLVQVNNLDYAAALESIERIEASDIYLVDLLKIILYRQSGMDAEARALQYTLLEKYPFVETNLRTHLQHFLLDDQLIDHILQALPSQGIIAS